MCEILILKNELPLLTVPVHDVVYFNRLRPLCGQTFQAGKSQILLERLSETILVICSNSDCIIYKGSKYYGVG